MENREDIIIMLDYFWHSKQDLERWVGFDRDQLEKEFPDILKAWDNYKLAEKRLTQTIYEHATA